MNEKYKKNNASGNKRYKNKQNNTKTSKVISTNTLSLETKETGKQSNENGLKIFI